MIGLAGLSVTDENGLEEIHPALNITLRTYRHWQKLTI